MSDTHETVTEEELERWEDKFEWHEPAIGYKNAMRLIAEVRRLRNPSFDELIELVQRVLNEKYPADIFTGVSGDLGPRFVVAVRDLLKELDGSGHPQVRSQ